MTDPICTCEAHGAFAGDTCPACGGAGTRLLSGDRRRQLSKFVSGALRHFPGDAGLELDERGWTEYAALESTVCQRYGWAEPEHLEAVLATDPKGRFERDERGDREVVRAAYGHSVDVTLEPTDEPVPDELYHGTAPSNLPSIREDGLAPMSRQRVHLSGSSEAALAVGRRHASDPVVLAIDAAAMLADGRRIARRGPETYTTEAVPPAYLSIADADP